MIGRLVAMLDRLSPAARRAVVAAACLLALAIVSSALTPTRRMRQPTHGAPGLVTTSSVPASPGSQRRPGPVPAAQLARVRAMASRFLESYLPFAYGRTSVRSARAVSPALRQQLRRDRAQVTPAEQRRHPRVVSLQLVGTTPEFVVATATIDDGGVTTYRLRFTLQNEAGRWAVSAVEQG